MNGLVVFAARVRLLVNRQLARFGVRDDSFLALLAVLVGIVTAAAAVAFHELINHIRDWLYVGLHPVFNLYGRGIWLLVLLPAAGGLVVGVLTRYVFRTREGHGIVDVMVSVFRSSGFIRPIAAVEKILTSAVTIGSGGSAGAEGPIVQIGSAIASGIGQLFGVARQQMPLLIGCGTAAGISAVFNSPLGGVLFALEVILYDFSIRTFAPVVVASVIANVATKGIYSRLLHLPYKAIFAVDLQRMTDQPDLRLSQVPIYVLLGVVCGVVGVSLTRMMYASERRFSFNRLPAALRPAAGGAALGLMGALYVIVFGWLLLGADKPFAFHHYPMPAFFGDGYGVIRRLFEPDFYTAAGPRYAIALLAFLCIVKIPATCLTLSSGGSGGIIAPSLFLGATTGGLVGLILQRAGLTMAQPAVCAMVGMAAVLAAVVHAPLASILILVDLTVNPKLLLPAMLAAIIATGTARLIFRDSIYTLSLRLRGVHVGSAADLSVLRRLTVEQVNLEPATVVHAEDPLQKVLDLVEGGTSEFVVVDGSSELEGMVTAEEVRLALLQREAIPLLLVRDVMRSDVPAVACNDDLATVMDTFARCEVSTLPVSLTRSTPRVIGLISRAALMKRYQKGLADS